ncbi:hypothetical protein SAMN05443665_10412 [Actinomadura meyerae]|uniref:SET domain-containing protein n=1 Tax=Actinomadura meyerae TaxID=240840 RepID=A0A239NHJ3_9ACTN|nr:hypothetical protein SAMN05443665_10412 [Actinomadura meyerae]
MTSWFCLLPPLVADLVCLSATAVSRARLHLSRLHGRGVFARRAFTAGQLIERCPVLLVPPDQVARLDRTMLYDYYFDWDAGAAAIALGYGSLYNHDTAANARYHKDFGAAVVDIIATRQVSPGDEITVDYTRGGTNPLWFSPSPPARG